MVRGASLEYLEPLIQKKEASLMWALIVVAGVMAGAVCINSAGSYHSKAECDAAGGKQRQDYVCLPVPRGGITLKKGQQ